MSSLSSVPQLGFSGVSSPGGLPVPGIPTAPPGTTPQGPDPSDKRSQSAPQSNNPSIQRALAMRESVGGAPLVTAGAAHGSLSYEQNEEPNLAAQTGGGQIGKIVIVGTATVNAALLAGFLGMLLVECKRDWARNATEIEGNPACTRLHKHTQGETAKEVASTNDRNANLHARQTQHIAPMVVAK